MELRGIRLVWIVVKDLEVALDFYIRVAGLSLREKNAEYGWAELSGPEGILLGIAEESASMDEKAGSNGVVALSVKNLEAARVHFIKQGATLVGEVVEVPGHVKMQTFVDIDGNKMQLVEELFKGL